MPAKARVGWLYYSWHTPFPVWEKTSVFPFYIKRLPKPAVPKR
jgi:hypothetical protein